MTLPLTKYIACICEGEAERAIVDLLLENKLLIFERSQMLDEEVIRSRGAKEFETRYLRKEFDDKITVIRVLDSRSENFKISKTYEHKIEIINVVTAPEIEMLIIFSEQKFSDYQKSRKKPSDFCKQNLKMGKNVKHYDFVRNYFSESSKLITAIKDYDAHVKKAKNLPKGTYTLSDLLIQERPFRPI